MAGINENIDHHTPVDMAVFKVCLCDGSQLGMPF
jgi:hypothetical protein